METFIAHFDILGYKEFINNNEKDYVDRNNDHIFRESQSAVSNEKYIEQVPGTIVPDLRNAEVNCMHFSDTILFWTNTATEEDFLKLVYVCYTFYWRCMQTTFAVRGCLGFGDIEFSPYQINGKGGAKFINSSLFGKGLVDVYLKAENQDWAGCFIDKSAIKAKLKDALIITDKTITDLIYQNILVYYPVPLKGGIKSYEYAIRIIGSQLNNVAFKNMAEGIERIFTHHMAGKPLNESAIRKMHNTIEFLNHFRVEFPKENLAQ